MKILYDHQIFSLQVRGGISRYFYELIKNIQEKENVSLLTKLSNNYYLNKIPIEHRSFFEGNSFRGKSQLMKIYNNYYTKKKLKEVSYDIFHPTYYDTYFLKSLKNSPFVITVHDMIHEKFREMFPKRDNTIANKKEIMQRAQKIIAISENTKKDILNLYDDIEESKIKVIYHGNSLNSGLIANKNIKFDFPKNYILYVGERAGYKNFMLFAEAVIPILKKERDLKILCIGGGKFTVQELLFFRNSGVDAFFEQHNLSDEELVLAYQKAMLFVYPSIYEGFGMPILEAFECECPIACSNTSSFPEIAGKGAYFFDPYRKESIYESIRYVLYNDSLRKKMVRKGKEMALAFSWEKTCQKTVELYKNI